MTKMEYKLVYIDEKYAIPFTAMYTSNDPAADLTNLAFEAIIMQTITSFGDTIDVPEVFMEHMLEKDFDRFLETIFSDPASLVHSFYMIVAQNANILLLRDHDGSVYRLFALNDIYWALLPNQQFPVVNNIVRRRHECIDEEFTMIAS